MIERIYTREIQMEFGCKDYRTVRNWCDNNGVQIFCDKGSRLRYVIKSEFELAKVGEPFKYLKEKYGEENLSDVLNAHMKFSAEYWQAFDENKKKNAPKNEIYKPKGRHEKNFLSILLKIKPEL